MLAESFRHGLCAPGRSQRNGDEVAAGARKKVDRRDPHGNLSSEEVRLAQLLHAEDDMEPSELASLLRRDKSAMTRLLVMGDNASCACEAFAPLDRENEVREDQAVAAHSRRRLGS